MLNLKPGDRVRYNQKFLTDRPERYRQYYEMQRGTVMGTEGRLCDYKVKWDLSKNPMMIWEGYLEPIEPIDAAGEQKEASDGKA